jgi:transcriptional regulator with XRE-family HTH domain
MSMYELKAKTGINVWRLEQGYFTPKIQTLSKIAAALDVTLSDLLKDQ